MLLYAYAGCSSHETRRVLEIVNLMFCGIAGKVPSHQTILDWVVKCGLSISKDVYKKESLRQLNSQMEEGYHIIMDNSVNYNNQELHLELAAPARHLGHAPMHTDVRVVNMSVGTSWRYTDIIRQAKISEI